MKYKITDDCIACGQCQSECPTECITDGDVYVIDSNFALFWPEEYKGKWSDYFKNDNKIILDIGCGSGEYSLSEAKKNQNKNYILWDKDPDVLVYTLQNLLEEKLNNVVLIPRDIRDIDKVFDENEVSSITIHFPNPWPKNTQNNRRLTHPNKLVVYKKILINNGLIDFRTDDEELYKDTINYIKKVNGNILFQSANSPATSTISHYEKRFRSNNIPIKSIQFTL